MEKASSSDHTEVLVVSSKTELKVSFAGTLLNPQTWNKCCMPAISCTELTIKQDPGLPVQFVLCFLFQPWLLRFPEVSPGQLVLKVSWIGYCHPNGRMPTYFSLYSPTCFPCKCSRKALSPVPSGGQWWEPKIQRTKNSQGRGKKKNKSKPKPLLWIQSCLWGKLRRSKAYSVPFNWFTLHPKQHSPTPLMWDKKTRLQVKEKHLRTIPFEGADPVQSHMHQTEPSML